MENLKIIKTIQQYLITLQTNICNTLNNHDSTPFLIDDWQRAEGGGGSTRILNNGDVFERAGVNYSHVFGKSLPPAATVQRPELAGFSFEAMGVSVVVHPKNPHVPTSHLNVRFFIAYPEGAKQKKTSTINGSKDVNSAKEKETIVTNDSKDISSIKENLTHDPRPIWWFGGGLDLTPYYPYPEDCIHWHQTAAKACQPFGETVYQEYKKNCDDYFYLKHRQEARGIGGLFFDDLNHWPVEICFDFIRSIGDHYLFAYEPIINKRKHYPYTTREREFQLYRRGRYVEFNLLYDRGTLFGLQSGGRTESILMSLPPKVHWEYNYQIDPNSKEAQLAKDYLIPKDWI